MGLYLADGTRVTSSSVTTGTVADPEVVVNEDLYRQRTYPNADDQSQHGGEKTVFCKAGAIMRQSQLDALFKTVIDTPLSPASGPFGGGTVVTVAGQNVDGISAVTINGVAATALTAVTPQEFQFTTPNMAAAGTYDVVLTADDGDHTIAGGFTAQ